MRAGPKDQSRQRGQGGQGGGTQAKAAAPKGARVLWWLGRAVLLVCVGGWVGGLGAVRGVCQNSKGLI